MLGLGAVGDSETWALRGWKVKSPELGRKGLEAGTGGVLNKLVEGGFTGDKLGMLPGLEPIAADGS